MPAKFAYAQWPWGTKTREEFIDACRDMSDVGFRYFESVKAFIEVFQDNIPDFKAICSEYDITPISFYFHLRGNVENDIIDLKNKLGFIEAVGGVPSITLQGETIRGRTATQDELEYAVRTITEIGDICAPYGIKPAVHPHYNTTIMTASEIDYVMSRLDPDKIGFGPDTAHLSAGGCNPGEIFERYKERINFVHLKDLKGALSDGGMEAGVEVYDSFRELGEGDIDYKPVFQALKSVDFSGYLCLELDRTRYTNKISCLMNKHYMEKNW